VSAAAICLSQGVSYTNLLYLPMQCAILCNLHKVFWETLLKICVAIGLNNAYICTICIKSFTKSFKRFIFKHVVEHVL